VAITSSYGGEVVAVLLRQGVVATRAAEEVAMIWALLVFVGVPLWLCVMGIAAVVFRNRSLRKRYGDIPVRVLPPGKTRWTRGHALWVSDVFTWRGSPAAWSEGLEQVVEADVGPASSTERTSLRRLPDPVVAGLTTVDGQVVRVAAAADQRVALMGPFAAAPRQS
jgi:hypothetical protein